MEFVKISDTRYKTEVPIDMQICINNMLKELSLDDVDGYVDHLNTQLLYSMYARYVASEFFKSDSFEIGVMGFVVIDAYIGKEIVSVSLGKSEAKEGEVKKLAGVMWL